VNLLSGVRGLHRRQPAEGVHGAAQLRAAAQAQLHRGPPAAQHGHLGVRGQDTGPARQPAGAVG